MGWGILLSHFWGVGVGHPLKSFLGGGGGGLDPRKQMLHFLKETTCIVVMLVQWSHLLTLDVGPGRERLPLNWMLLC